MYINLVKVCDVTSCRHSFAARQPKAIQYLATANWAAVLPDHLSTKLCGAVHTQIHKLIVVLCITSRAC